MRRAKRVAETMHSTRPGPWTALIAVILAAILAGCSAPALETSETRPHGTQEPSDKDDTDWINERFAAARPGDKIDLPAQDYEVRGHIILPRSSDVSIDATGARFRGQAVFLSIASTGMSWSGGSFVGDGTSEQRLVFSLFRMNRAKFTNMSFERTTAFANHTFDLLGCKEVTLENITIEGYGASQDIVDLSPHERYAEAIQIDTAHETGVGNERAIELIEEAGGVFDGSATSGLVVRDSYFGPSRDAAGDLRAWAPSPLGSHAYASEGPPSDVVFERNRVVSPIPMRETSGGRWAGALHFAAIQGLTVRYNDFDQADASRRDAWLQFEQRNAPTGGRHSGIQPSTEDIVVEGNTFDGAPPLKAYVLFDAFRDDAEASFLGVTIANNAFFTDDAEAPVVAVRGHAGQVEDIDQSANTRMPAPSANG